MVHWAQNEVVTATNTFVLTDKRNLGVNNARIGVVAQPHHQRHRLLPSSCFVISKMLLAF